MGFLDRFKRKQLVNMFEKLAEEFDGLTSEDKDFFVKSLCDAFAKKKVLMEVTYNG